MEKRDKKRLTIGAIYLSLLGLLVFGLWFWLTPAATCFDGKQNQNEKSVDCGGICRPCEEQAQAEPLKIAEQKVVAAGAGKYDAFVKVQNPNNQVGVVDLGCTFILKDKDRNEITRQTVKSFILPSDIKYIPVFNLSVPEGVKVSFMEAELQEPVWQKFEQFEKPNLNFFSKQYSQNIEGAKVQAVLRNESSYSLAKVQINVILRDETGEPLAINRTERENIRSKEERALELIWPQSVADTVASVEMEAEVNAFDVANFINLPQN